MKNSLMRPPAITEIYSQKLYIFLIKHLLKPFKEAFSDQRRSETSVAVWSFSPVTAVAHQTGQKQVLCS